MGQLAPEHRLRRLELLVTRRLDGLLHGQHLGLLPGPGSEFTGAREYRPGEDEVRRMDWAVTARTTLPHVREVDADRELTTWLLVDATPSMDFGTAELDKRELAVAAVAAVGFLTAGVGNRLGAHLLAGTGIRRFPARTGRAHLLGLLRLLLTARRADTSADTSAGTGSPSGRPSLFGRPSPVGRPPSPAGRPSATDVPSAADIPSPAGRPSLADAITTLHRAAAGRGLAVLVSDFLDGLPDGEGGTPAWERAVRRLAVRHQVLAVEVVDPRELELPDVGLVTLVDPETGRRREVSTADRRLRERYAAAAAGQRELVRQALRRAGATHLPLRTDSDWVAEIVRHVHTQRRLAGAARPPVAAVRGGAA
ncbi:DUF58 domain-containing protein [Plantactinospora endophytica]|uniref:DUF58 domain-containing protein n=1 Tax=Plantactinospora endophytica TaxID=673535 RepID=UPI001EF1BF1B|nr:DUF58 domain-containing protein [Plantactinospora endophytica]